MSDHLSPELLSALADGELPDDQLSRAQAHLAECAACTSSALAQSLMKTATAKAGRMYAPPQDLQARMTKLARQEAAATAALPGNTQQSGPAAGFTGWAVAFALTFIFGCVMVVGHNVQRNALASSEFTGLITEAVDQHVATLAANLPPQVVSSDRHTVKPWFQGKMPFSFNLPENLPVDARLEGGNLTYLHGQTAALLLYRIGNHRASLFVMQKNGAETPPVLTAEHAGFHAYDFSNGELEVVGISDVDPARLFNLVQIFEQAQMGARPPVN